VSAGEIRQRRRMRGQPVIAAIALVTLLAGCGGSGSGNGNGSGSAPPAFSSVPQVRVSQPATFTSCSSQTQVGTLYSGTALEPSLVVNPTNTSNLIAEWQQDRWSTGGSQALNLGASSDGGMTWTVTSAAFSVCTGGNVNNAGNYLRASNGWLSVSPSGLVYALSLSFSGGALLAGSSSGQLVSRSLDGGFTWSLPVALIADGADFFDDKGSITADPTNANYVYAVWDRINTENSGSSYFAVTADGGNTWQPATSIYTPGTAAQTIGNIIVVLPGDIVLDIASALDTAGSGATAALFALRSTDNGTTWSGPVMIATEESVGTKDPLTGAGIRDSTDLPSVSVSPGGSVYVVWQDSSFSAGERDGIAMSSSADGGQTWSAPVEVNGDPSAAAFTPNIHVSADGVIGITYYDLRNDTLPGSILTDFWMVTSSDGSNFSETHLSGPFNLLQAPEGEFGPDNTLGYFLGDYQALSSNGGAFLPMNTQTNLGTAISSDVFIDFPPPTAAAAAAAQATSHATPRAFKAVTAPPGLTLSAAVRQRVAARIRRLEAERLQRGR
jgi:hypothetical protein